MGHSRVFAYVFTPLAFLSTILAAVLGGLSGSNFGGIFNRSMGNISDKYDLELTPASYVFGVIWPINFLWTIIGKIYLVISLFLSDSSSPVKMKPALAPLVYLIFDTLSFACTNGWYFTFDVENLGWCYALLVGTALFMYVAIGATLKRVADNEEALQKNNKTTLWLVRILLQNGLCTFATWITTASILGLMIVIVYVDSPDFPVATQRGLISMVDASSVGAGLLLGLALVYFVLENFVLEKYLRYMFTTYPVLIFAFSGVIYKLVNEGGSKQNIIFASVNISVCSFLFITRIILSVYRSKNRPSKFTKFGDEKKNLDIDQI